MQRLRKEIDSTKFYKMYHYTLGEQIPIYFYQSKEVEYAGLRSLKFGSLCQSLYINNAKCEVTSDTAHFLEHAILQYKERNLPEHFTFYGNTLLNSTEFYYTSPVSDLPSLELHLKDLCEEWDEAIGDISDEYDEMADDLDYIFYRMQKYYFANHVSWYLKTKQNLLQLDASLCSYLLKTVYRSPETKFLFVGDYSPEHVEEEILRLAETINFRLEVDYRLPEIQREAETFMLTDTPRFFALAFIAKYSPTNSSLQRHIYKKILRDYLVNRFESKLQLYFSTLENYDIFMIKGNLETLEEVQAILAELASGKIQENLAELKIGVEKELISRVELDLFFTGLRFFRFNASIGEFFACLPQIGLDDFCLWIQQMMQGYKLVKY